MDENHSGYNPTVTDTVNPISPVVMAFLKKNWIWVLAGLAVIIFLFTMFIKDKRRQRNMETENKLKAEVKNMKF